MAYRVDLSPRTFDDIDAVVEHIWQDSPLNAVRWYHRLFAKLAKLGSMPRSCSLAPKNDYCSFEVRQTMYGRYRILFTIRDKDSRGYFLTVRHGARTLMRPDELERL